jgi:hypothetical protein
MSNDLVSKDSQGNEFDHEQNFLKDPGYRDSFIKNYKDHMEDSLAAQYGGEPTPETWQWWHNSSGPILDKFKDYLAMLPDEEQRQKMFNVFALRHSRLNSEFKETPGQVEQPGVSLGNAKTVPLDSGKTDVSNQGTK